MVVVGFMAPENTSEGVWHFNTLIHTNRTILMARKGCWRLHYGGAINPTTTVLSTILHCTAYGGCTEKLNGCMGSLTMIAFSAIGLGVAICHFYGCKLAVCLNPLHSRNAHQRVELMQHMTFVVCLAGSAMSALRPPNRVIVE